MLTRKLTSSQKLIKSTIEMVANRTVKMKHLLKLRKLLLNALLVSHLNDKSMINYRYLQGFSLQLFGHWMILLYENIKF